MPIDAPFEDDLRAELVALNALEVIYQQLGLEAHLRGDDTEAGLI